MGMGRSAFTRLPLLALGALVFIAASCARNEDCGGPQLNLAQIDLLRQTTGGVGPTAGVIAPNPLDASGIATISLSDSRVDNYQKAVQLPSLLSPTRLESDVLKIRIHAQSDDVATLAAPDSSGRFVFRASDVHYSEVLAYHSVHSISSYVQSLGFSYLKDRPLYILVRSQSANASSDTVNAYFENNYLNPSLPRLMHMVGDTNYAPGVDRQMYWHESGHWANESVSNQIGIDRAGDMGARYTEGAALHEAMADIIAESLANQSNIGDWVNLNFSGVTPGTPLRSAVDTANNTLTFQKVGTQDNTGAYPERYAVAEWITRVLWEIRAQFVKEDTSHGSVFADRLFLSAVSLLGKDTSISQFRDALVQADSQLHCGIHGKSINSAFVSRGFASSPAKISTALKLTNQAVTDSASGTRNITFDTTISNSNSQVARNVRLVLESLDSRFHPVVYMQGFGDIPAGSSAIVGTGGLSGDYSVSGTVDSSVGAGTSIRYRLTVQVENGPSTVQEGVLQL
jgi:hypothetical protein